MSIILRGAILFLFSCFLCENYNVVRAMATKFNFSHIHSDVIVTTGVKAPSGSDSKRAIPVVEEENEEQPGWIRRQLMKFGEVATRIGNSMGGTASKITKALDKVCEVVKTVIPVIAAVCHVGSFQFCTAANEAPQDLAAAIAPNNFEMDLDK